MTTTEIETMLKMAKMVSRKFPEWEREDIESEIVIELIATWTDGQSEKRTYTAACYAARHAWKRLLRRPTMEELPDGLPGRCEAVGWRALICGLPEEPRRLAETLMATDGEIVPAMVRLGWSHAKASRIRGWLRKIVVA